MPARSQPRWKRVEDHVAERDREPLADVERWVSYQLDDLRPPWHAQAHCLGSGFENFFTDDEGDIFASIATTTRGRKVCDACPAFTDCLRASLVNKEKFGIWAGVSARQRKRHLAAIERGEKTIEIVMEEIMLGVRPDDESRGRTDSAQRRTG